MGTDVDGIRLFMWCVSIDLMLGSLRGNKLIAAVGLAVVIITMMTSNQLSIYASSTTEDDGYTYPDDASDEEKEEIDEQEQEAWEDAGRPGDNDNDDDNEDDDNEEQADVMFTCPDGSVVSKNAICPAVLPYCDTDEGKAAVSCHDRYDYDQITGLYPCLDGSQVSDPQDCGSASERLNELGGTAQLAPGQVPLENKPCLYDTSLPQCAPVDGNCRDGYGKNEDGRCFPEHSKCPDGYHGHEDDESGECISNNTSCDPGYVMTVMTNGSDNCEQKQQISCIDVPFYMTCDSQKKKNDKDSNNNSGSSSSSSSTTKTIVVNPTSSTANAADVSTCKLDGSTDGIQQIFDTAKYQACKLHTPNDKIYYDGFVTGCMNVGNTKLICEAVANSNILNINTQNPQTPAATTIPQSLQAIQPAAVN